MQRNKFNRAICSISFAILLGAITTTARAQTQPPASLQIPGGADPNSLNYAETGSNSSGRAIYAVRPGSSARAALNAAIGDLTKLLGVTPKITSGFVDNKTDRGGGANFTATVNGTPLKGSILAGVGSNGTIVSIIYAVANCPTGDWSALLADLPASIKLTPTPFGNGVGTIGLPDGWNIGQSNNTGTVIVIGPQRQQVVICMTMLVMAPGSPEAIQQQQFAQMARQFGHKPLPGNPVASYATPDNAMQAVFPYFSNNSVANGAPSEEFTQLIAAKPQPPNPNAPNTETAFVYYSSTINTPGQPTLQRALAQITCTHLTPMLHGEWGFSFSLVSAPDNIFDREMPTLIAVWNSYNVDVQKALANGQTNMAAIQATFKQAEANMKASEDATDQMIADSQAQEMASDRSSADEDEIIRGYRTVEDTQTGDQADVNLADSHAIVDKLNEGDPGRYVEIPLRDTLDPF